MTEIDASEPSRERLTRVSLRPALIVVAIVAVIVVGGGLLAIFSGKGTKTKDAAAVPSRLIVEGVTFGQARATLLKTEHSPLIPEDIISSLAIPVDARLTGVVDLDDGNGPFDRQVNLASAAAQSQLVQAYSTLLDEYGWRQSGAKTTAGPTGSKGTQLLAQHASRDGYNWEVGVTITIGAHVNATMPPIDPRLRRTHIAMRLLQVPEGN